MQYKYLARWVEENSSGQNRAYISDVLRWGNRLALIFKNRDAYLHLELEGSNPFLFFSPVDQLQLFPLQYDRYKSFTNHLVGALLTGIEISCNDRLLFLTFEKKDIYNQRLHYRLVLELIPRKTNAILVKSATDGEKGWEKEINHNEGFERNHLGKTPDKEKEHKNEEIKHEGRKGRDSEPLIVDCLKCFSLSDGSSRALLPHQPYQLPIPVATESPETFSYPLSLEHTEKSFAIKEGGQAGFNDINSLFRTVFDDVIIPAQLNRVKDSRIKELLKKKKRLVSKLDKLRKESDDYADGELYKQQAELLKYNLQQIEKGADKVVLTNYYADPPSDMEIELQKDKTPLENMNLYFKKYRKSLSGKETKEKQINLTEEEIEVLDRDIFDVENSDFAELLQLQTASSSRNSRSSNPKAASSKKGKEPLKQDRFKRLRISQHWEVFIGRTATENDELTTRFAKPEDWWFHSRVYQGSHIILRNYLKQDVPEELVVLCCRLAAWFSKAKHSTNVPVDYTKIRYVTKPHKSPPGYVIYKNQKTMYANPLSMREAAAQLPSG